MEEFFEAVAATPYRKMIEEERLGFPTVNVKAEFFVPLVYGDEAVIEVRVSSCGTSSAVFEYNVRRASDSTLCARASHVQVAMNLDERKSVPIPDKYRRAFENEI